MRNFLIVCDASPLIALADIGELHILKELYQEVLITDVVRKEILTELPDWIGVSSDYEPSDFKHLQLQLDAGEASAIALALKNPGCRLVIDERKGRLVAKAMGLKIVGLLGVVVKAKELGVITSGKTILDKLEIHGFWLSEKLKRQLLEKLGE